MSNQRLWIAGGVGAILIIICALLLIWNTVGQSAPLLSATQIGDRVQAEYPGEIMSVVQEDDAYQVKLESATGVYALTIGAHHGEVRSIRQLQSTSTAKADSPANGIADASGNTSAAARNGAATDSAMNEHSTIDDSGAGTSGKTGNTSGTPSASNRQNEQPNNTGSPSSSSKNPASSAASTASGGTSPSDKATSGTSPASVASSMTAKQAEQIALGQVKGEVDDVKFKHSGKTGQQYYLVEIETPHDREAVVQINAISGAVMSVTWDDEDDAENKDQQN